MQRFPEAQGTRRSVCESHYDFFWRFALDTNCILRAKEDVFCSKDANKIEKNQLQAQKEDLEMHHRKTVSELERQHERVLDDWQKKHGEVSQEKLGLLQAHEDGQKRVKSLEEAVSELQGQILDQNVNIGELEGKQRNRT